MRREELILDILLAESRSGVYCGAQSLPNGTKIFDRRMRPEMVESRGLSPRSADLNIIGPVTVELTDLEYEILTS